MEFTVGEVVEGKVKSITNFGAFVSLPNGRTGMVHISEIAYTYVSDIHQHLSEGQDVKVMILAVDPAGKINLSIKRTQPQPERPQRRQFERRSDNRGQQNRAPERQQERRPQQERRAQQEAPAFHPHTPAAPRDQSFEDKLKQFMSESDSKLSSIRQYSDHKTKTRRR